MFTILESNYFAAIFAKNTRCLLPDGLGKPLILRMSSGSPRFFGCPPGAPVFSDVLWEPQIFRMSSGSPTFSNFARRPNFFFKFFFATGPERNFIQRI